MSKDNQMTPKEKRKEEMFAMIDAWKASGQSQYEFNKAAGVAHSNFQYWYKKYREQHEPGSASSFVAVKIKPISHALIFAELVLPDGKKLCFHQPVDASFLRSLLS